MRTPRILFLAALALLLTNSQAGVIRGTIRAQTPNLDQQSEGGGAYQSRRFKFLEKIDYSKLDNFVVSIADVALLPDSNAPRPTAEVEQKDGVFVPLVLPIVAGTEVAWPNRDEVYHNVFSMSEARPFDLGMYKSNDDPKRLVFEKPGQIDVFCAIHSEMNCVVLVLPNPWFSLSDRRGQFEINDVPPGTYRLKAWHERLPPKFVEVTVTGDEVIELDIVMGFAGLPKI